MARNRKRAKERRARRPQPVGTRAREQMTGAPSPLEHAAPDAEIAEQAELPPNVSEPELEELALEEPAEDEDAFEPEELPEQAAPETTAGPIADARPRTGDRLVAD